MIDDIRFSQICPKMDTVVVVAVQNPTIQVSEDDTICDGGTKVLVASSNDPNVSYTWNGQANQNDTLPVSPGNTTTYSVFATSQFGCNSDTIETVVTVNETPGISLVGSDTVCFEQNLLIKSNPIGANIGFSWIPALSSK